MKGPGPGGHTYSIPAALCYGSSPVDRAYGLSNVIFFNAKTCYPGS